MAFYVHKHHTGEIMKLVHSEWKDRVEHWIRTLKDDLYEPLGEITWEAFTTMEYLTPEEAWKGPF